MCFIFLRSCYVAFILIANKEISPFLARLKPSKKLQQLVITVHLIALVASFANALPIAIKLIVAALIGLNFWISFPKLIKEQRGLRYSEKRGWEMAEGRDFTAVDILKSTVVTTVFIFLHIRDKPAILIANDALSEDDYRQLIVKLKMTVR